MTERDSRRRSVGARRCATLAALVTLFVPLTAYGGDAAAIYKSRCALCHGETGAGDGAAAAMLKPSPTNFRSAAFWATAKPEKLEQTILEGSPGTAMVPFGGTLSDGEVTALVDYLRTFAR